MAHFNLGNVLATSGRSGEAVGHFQQAIRLNPNYPEAYGNLAAALLRLNEPALALVTATKGVDIARSTGQTVAAERLEAWLNQFRDRLTEAAGDSPVSGSAPTSQPTQ